MKIRSFKPKQFNNKQSLPSSEGRSTEQPVEEKPQLAGETVQKLPQNVTTQNTMQVQPRTPQKPQKMGGGLRLIPLGGVGLVQKNMYIYEYGEDIVIIDCGVGFPTEGMPGVDLIIPDISYLRDRKHKIRGIVITHAHEDHIGALPYIWPELRVPIYSQKLTCGFIKNKFTDHHLPKDDIKTIGIDAVLDLGVFNISFYRVSHSVPDSTGIIIKTPVGTLVHQADYKIDWTPLDEREVPDVGKAAQVGSTGVNFMTIDCLGVERPGYTPSEKTIQPTFERIEKTTKGKMIITLMTSNISRIQQALNVASLSGRKVAVAGRSMENNFQVSRDLGYLDVPPNLLINQEQIKQFPDEKLMLIMAGSLGQPGSALSRAANMDHKYIQIKKSDTVVFSADPMPSAVVPQGDLIDKLTKIGCEVYASTLTPDLHVSGHASMEEIKLMINLVRPKYLMPIGGEFHHMKAFQKMAMDLGYPEANIMLPDEGEVVNINQNKVFINGRVETSNVYVDGLGVGDVGSIVLRDRQVMSAEGIVVVIVPIDSKSGQVSGEPDVISRGFVFEKQAEDLIDAAKQVVKSCLHDRKGGVLDWRYSRNEIETNLEKFFYQETKRNPLILPVVVEV